MSAKCNHRTDINSSNTDLLTNFSIFHYLTLNVHEISSHFLHAIIAVAITDYCIQILHNFLLYRITQNFGSGTFCTPRFTLCKQLVYSNFYYTQGGRRIKGSATPN